MNEHLTKDASLETLFKPNNPWLTNKKDTKSYMLLHLKNIKLSRFQYIATSIINYGTYIDDMFVLEESTNIFLE